MTHRSASVGYDLNNTNRGGGAVNFADEAKTMSRSQSAAPTFLQPQQQQQSRANVGPPPGLSVHRSNSIGGGGGGNSMRQQHREDHYGRQQAGLRRPASAGLINEEHDASSSVLASLGLESSSAVRPAPKTLMDLIKEDTPPPGARHHDDFYGNTNAAAALGITRSQTAGPAFYESGYGDRTTSPLSSRLDSLERFERNAQQQAPSMRYQQADQQMGGLSHQMDRMQVGGRQQQQYAVPQPRVSIHVCMHACIYLYICF